MSDSDIVGLVFDVPDAAWTREIQELRLAHDSARAGFPVEITVAGSSGLGLREH